MRIWVHSLVRNEERYLWFAVMSVIDRVDQVLLWDTGSTDSTVSIIKEIKKIYPNKVDFRQVGSVDINQFTDVRNGMLEKTESDWFVIVDGDEVWWEDAIKEVVSEIKRNGKNLDSIVSRYYNVVGDLYHHEEEKAGAYEIDGKRGHLTIRAIRRTIPGLHVANPHGTQGFFDKDGTLIQERDRKVRDFIAGPAYLHFTHLIRSLEKKDLEVPKRKIKLKYEVGKDFPLDFFYPEVFFRQRPSIVSSPWAISSGSFKLRSLVYSPLRRLKKSLIKPGLGY